MDEMHFCEYRKEVGKLSEFSERFLRKFWKKPRASAELLKSFALHSLFLFFRGNFRSKKG